MRYKKIVEGKDSKERLDKYITKNLSGISRSYINFLVHEGRVKVNGRREKSSYKIEEGDLVEWEDFPKKQFLDTGEKLKIIYKDNNVLVIDKPYGIAVHPKETQKPRDEITVLDILVKGFPGIKKIKGLRPGIVHRLDKDTSGVLIVALNTNTFEFLKKEFKERRVTKVYQALLFGKLEPKEGVIDAHVGRNPKNRSKMTVVPESEGKDALTSYKVVKYFHFGRDVYTLILAYPKTGRTHQIRVHFSSIGHPLVGDTLYGPQKIKAGIKRQFLHAFKLSINLPGNGRKTFFSNLSLDLESFLKKISK